MSEWISVESELPPMNTKFDAWTDKGTRLAEHGEYVGSWDEDFRRDVMKINGITHWMPLPEPPQPEDK